MKNLCFLVVVAHISACVDVSADNSNQIDVSEKKCAVSDYDHMVGTNIKSHTLPAPLLHRIIPPGSMVTEDYIPTRVNFYTDNAGIIQDVTCG